MKTTLKFALRGITGAICAAPLAHALPPPLPLSVTVVPHLSVGDVAELHGKAAVQALEQEGWLKLGQSPAPLSEALKTQCHREMTRLADCLRENNRRHAANKENAFPHVYLIVQGNTHQALVTCIGSGARASNPEAQRTIINLKAGLYGPYEERQPELTKLRRCLLAAREE